MLQRMEGMSLLELSLETGRTDQIRVHLAHIGYPVIGDATYGEGQSAGLPPRPRRGWSARCSMPGG